MPLHFHAFTNTMDSRQDPIFSLMAFLLASLSGPVLIYARMENWRHISPFTSTRLGWNPEDGEWMWCVPFYTYIYIYKYKKYIYIYLHIHTHNQVEERE